MSNEPFDVEINGCRLTMVDTGPEDGPVVLTHHGGGGIGSLAEPLSTYGPLADRGYRVIAYDARGCGRSEGIPPYSHEQWAADMDAIRVWAGADQVTVAGGSYGGFMSLEYVTRYPEHTNAVMLRDTAASGRDCLRLVFENARNQDRIELPWDDFTRYWTGQIRDDDDLKARWAEMIGLYDHEYDPAKDAAKVEAGIYRHEAHNACMAENFNAFDVRPLLPQVSVPVLVNVGRYDWVCPVPCSQEIAELVPDSELVIYEHSGHSPQFEEYERFQQVMGDFMARHAPVPGAQAAPTGGVQ